MLCSLKLLIINFCFLEFKNSNKLVDVQDYKGCITANRCEFENIVPGNSD